MKWFFTAHSIPCTMAKESTYVQDLTRTAELVCQKLNRKQWSLAYSSRSGNPRDPWLEPDVCDVIQAEATQGTKTILFIPIGFIADHVEILFDLDIEAQAAAKEAGVVTASTVPNPSVIILFSARMMAERRANPHEPTGKTGIRKARTHWSSQSSSVFRHMPDVSRFHGFAAPPRNVKNDTARHRHRGRDHRSRRGVAYHSALPETKSSAQSSTSARKRIFSAYRRFAQERHS